MNQQEELERARLHPDVLKNLAKNKKLKTTGVPTKTSDLENDSGFVDAAGAAAAAPVQSVNSQTGAVVLDAEDVGALPDSYTAPVQSVNGQTGAVSIFQSNDIGNQTAIPIGTTFTCPSDGYVVVFCAYNANAITRADICDQNGNEIIRFQVSNGSTNAIGINSMPVFVRKGMKIKGHSASNDGYIVFYPIV